MEGNLEERNNTIYCTKCGTPSSNNSSFCSSCGSRLIRKDEPEQVDDLQTTTTVVQQVETTQNSNKDIKKTDIFAPIILAIVSIGLAICFPPLIILVIALGIISLFSKKYRAYGIAVLSMFGISIVTIGLFILIIFGMCFAALG